MSEPSEPSRLQSREFRKAYAKLTEPTTVTAHGRVLGRWEPAQTGEVDAVDSPPPSFPSRSGRRNYPLAPFQHLVYNEGMQEAVIGYIRVSTDEQAVSGAGLEAQRTAILLEAERRGWHLVELIEDAGYSGKTLARPGIAAALEALSHRRADTLVVAKLDRLSRSMLDFAGLMDRATREHWSLVALDLGVDTSTPAGEAMASVLATFAQFERRLIGERTRAALAAKKRAGVRLGRHRTLPDEILERIVHEHSEGRSLTAIAEGLTADGVPTAQGGRQWWPSTVKKALGTAERDALAAAARAEQGRPAR